MVNEDVLNLCRKVLGAKSRRVLVTGGTGFVGSHVAATLAACGHKVTAAGRNRYLAPRGTLFRRVDLRDHQSVTDLCEGQDFVIHSAAHASPSLNAKQLWPTNVVGTQNVIDGCLKHDVKRLVHISSTAHQFSFRDAMDIREDDPPPRKWSCGYAETKAAAEELVVLAAEGGLNAFVVRARAVFGAGDNSLLPRVLQAYDNNRLRQIGHGDNITELTHIDNLVYGIILTLIRGEPGKICTITGGRGVALWPLIRRVLRETGRDRPLKSISRSIALRFAHLQELKHRFLKKKDEPTLTRYSVGLLSNSQTFSSGSAKSLLGYEPVVEMDHAIGNTIRVLSAQNDSHSSTTVELSLHSTGFTPHPLSVAEKGASRERVRFHAMIGIISHPVHGDTLFDTGYAPRFYDATAHWPYSLYSQATPVTTNSQNAARAIADRGQFSIRRILLSHFHADHICSVADFPNADVIAMKSAWESVSHVRGLSALKRAYIPSLIPESTKDRLCLFEQFHDAGIGPFKRCCDLFGDQSVRLVELPGHAVGQFGVLLQTGPLQRKLLVADAVWTRKTIEQDLPLTFAFKMIAANAHLAEQSRCNLVQFHRRYPDIEIIPTHCNAIAAAYGFDKQFPREVS